MAHYEYETLVNDCRFLTRNHSGQKTMEQRNAQKEEWSAKLDNH